MVGRFFRCLDWRQTDVVNRKADPRNLRSVRRLRFVGLRSGARLVWPPRYFSHRWSHAWIKNLSPLKRCFPFILVAACLWGAEWRGQTILIESDNTTVVAAVGSGTSRDESLMPLLRTLHYVMAKSGCVMRARHIPGNLNTFEDALSQGHLEVTPLRLLLRIRRYRSTSLGLSFTSSTTYS